MKRTKKALLAALACSAVLATGAFGLTACNKGNDGDSGEKHAHSWGNWTVTETNKPTNTATGKATRPCNGTGDCDAAATDKEHELPVLTSTDYSKGADSATCSATGSVQYTYNKDGVNVSFGVSTPVNSAAHKYGDYVEDGAEGHYQVCEHNSAHKTATEAHDTKGTNGACSVCGYEANHEHTFDTTTWDKDETGHWHPTNCGHDLDIKDSTSGYAAHTYGDWTVTTPATPTTEGEQTRTCTVEGCGYIDRQTIAKLPTPVTGSDDMDAPESISAGRYSVVINGEEVENYPGYPQYGTRFIADELFFEIAAGTQAKAYTVRLENETGFIANTNGETFIESVSVILEPGQSFVFYISADEVVNENGDTVIFVIEESAAPEAGDLNRPISAKEGQNGKIVADEDEKVYFKLSPSVFAGNKVKVTLGQGVTLYNLGTNWDDIVAGTATATQVTDGTIQTSDWYDTYLYAESRNRDGECYVTFEIDYNEGDKEKPFTAKTGTGDDNLNAVSGNSAQWFKLEATAGKYIIKPTSNNATLEIYNDVNGTAVISSTGSPVVFTLGDAPVYIKANTNYYGDFTFTVTEFTEADKGLTVSEPATLEGNGAELNVPENVMYYEFTVPSGSQNGLLTFIYKDGTMSYSDSLLFEVYSDAGFKNKVSASGRNNRLGINTEAGETYYIRVEKQWNTAGTTFSFSFGELVEHDYVITVTDGAETNPALPGGVTVTLTDSEGKELTETTVNGVATFANVDPSKSYTVSLSDLPEGFGYYVIDTTALTIGSNTDTVTNFTAKIYAYHEYTLTFTGADAGVDLSGISVALRDNQTLTTYRGETNENGVAVISALPPYGNGNFLVTVSMPESLKDKYVYVTESSRDLGVSDAQPEVEVPLSAIVTYNITLKDKDGAFLPDGTTVVVNGVSATVESGKVSIKTAAGAHAIIISGYATTVKTSPTEFDLEVECTVSVAGSSSYSNAPDLPMGSTPFIGTLNGSAYCKFTAAEDGVYTISIQLDSAYGMFGGGIGTARLNGSLSDFYNENYDTSKFDVVEWNGWYAGTFTVTLSAGDVVVLGINNSGTLNVTKA